MTIEKRGDQERRARFVAKVAGLKKEEPLEFVESRVKAAEDPLAIEEDS